MSKTIYDQFPVVPLAHTSILDTLGLDASPSAKYNADSTKTETMARLFIPMTTAEAGQFKFALRTASGGANIDDLANAIVIQDTPNGVTGAGYLYFLLDRAQEGFNEKAQVVDVVGDQYVAYLFGQSPPIFNYSGVLLNTRQDDWRAAFTVLYQLIARGSRMAKFGRAIVLSYDDVFITGTILSMQQVLSSTMQTAAQFSFSLLVKRYSILRRTPLDTRFIDTPAFAKGMKANSLLGLVSSVSGKDVESTKSVSLKAEVPVRGSNKPAPSQTESEDFCNQTVSGDQAEADAVLQMPTSVPDPNDSTTE